MSATRNRAKTRSSTVIAVAALIASCSFGRGGNDCRSIEEYQAAKVAPDLQVPAGLDKPDASGALAVPASPGTADAGPSLAEIAGCLERPPSYFDRPLAAPAN